MRNMKRIKLLFGLLACLLALASCANSIEYDKSTNVYADKKTGVSYTDAPSCYEPREIGKKYAAWRNEYATVDFYTVEGADPLLWLTEEGGTVFYDRDHVTLPELDEMECSEVLVCVEGTVLYAVADITAAEHISSLVALWETGESIDYPATEPTRNYKLKFVSEKYPFLYYNLVYVEYSDGAYLYCRDTGRCVPAGEIIADYLDGKLE